MTAPIQIPARELCHKHLGWRIDAGFYSKPILQIEHRRRLIVLDVGTSAPTFFPDTIVTLLPPEVTP